MYIYICIFLYIYIYIHKYIYIYKCIAKPAPPTSRWPCGVRRRLWSLVLSANPAPSISHLPRTPCAASAMHHSPSVAAAPLQLGDLIQPHACQPLVPRESCTANLLLAYKALEPNVERQPRTANLTFAVHPLRIESCHGAGPIIATSKVD